MSGELIKRFPIPELSLPDSHPERLGGKTNTQVLFKRAFARDNQHASDIFIEASKLAPTDLEARSVIISSILVAEEVSIRTESIKELEERLAVQPN